MIKNHTFQQAISTAKTDSIVCLLYKVNKKNIFRHNLCSKQALGDI